VIKFVSDLRQVGGFLRVLWVYLTHIDQPLTTVYDNVNVIEKNFAIKSLNASSMILENDEEIDLDAMVMCTGYKYKFPFLSEEIISTEGEHVTPLYKHVLHLNYHSLMVRFSWKICNAIYYGSCKFSLVK
jgi:hypothetical protein